MRISDWSSDVCSSDLHHAKCERDGDPHSPVVFGIGKVFFQGAELYREEATNADTLKRFGHGTPDDWLERNVYTRHSLLGVMIMLVLDLAFFGVIGEIGRAHV